MWKHRSVERERDLNVLLKVNSVAIQDSYCLCCFFFPLVCWWRDFIRIFVFVTHSETPKVLWYGMWSFNTWFDQTSSTNDHSNFHSQSSFIFILQTKTKMVSVRKFLCWDLYTAGIIIGWVSLAFSIVEILASYFVVDNVTVIFPGIDFRAYRCRMCQMKLFQSFRFSNHFFMFSSAGTLAVFGIFCALSVVDAIGSVLLILAVFKVLLLGLKWHCISEFNVFFPPSIWSGTTSMSFRG